jgi:hypothetical protein
LSTPPPPQVRGAVQVPQSSVPPQPSLAKPQSAPVVAQVCGTQPPPFPQTFGTPPPPQVSGAAQVPQSSVPPQPSGSEPQFAPSAAQVVGVQPPH